jgi:Rps23 Pro-64 3,4-dihydroxylase Tpa1-like proline 4-hydroxylase
MAHAHVVATPQERLFPYEKWSPSLPSLARKYRENQPCAHIHLPDFIDAATARALAAEFPALNTEAWTHYKHHNENKLGLSKRSMFPTALGEVVDELNSPEFTKWLSVLVGIPELLSDDMLEGGGLHQSARGGFLNVHTDFSMHHYHKHWRRRVNLILYLNPNWRDEWGGALEFWDTGMKQCVRKYSPLLNHAVIFTTNERSLHGFPDALNCPANESRKSLALYYYTAEDDDSLVPRSTDYRARPKDSLAERSMIWIDKKAVDLYSRAKARFGFSDDLASRVLAKFSGKK